MRRSSLLPTAALASALLLACSDQPGGTGPKPDATPTAPRSVERTIEHLGIGFGDDHYLVILGGTAENWAAFCATGAENWDAWTVLTVTRPDGSAKKEFQGRDLHALIWNLPADVCAESPDYTGMASFTGHDNDLDLSAQGANASGQNATGTVSDASGQDYDLLVAFNFTIKRIYTSADNYVLDQRVQILRLKPVGP